MRESCKAEAKGPSGGSPTTASRLGVRARLLASGNRGSSSSTQPASTAVRPGQGGRIGPLNQNGTPQGTTTARVGHRAERLRHAEDSEEGERSLQVAWPREQPTLEFANRFADRFTSGLPVLPLFLLTRFSTAVARCLDPISGKVSSTSISTCTWNCTSPRKVARASLATTAFRIATAQARRSCILRDPDRFQL